MLRAERFVIDTALASVFFVDIETKSTIIYKIMVTTYSQSRINTKYWLKTTIGENLTSVWKPTRKQ